MAGRVIEAHGLRREFGDLVAVDDLSVCVPDGSVVALLGPNGAGKTTTVRLLAGLLSPTAGEATVAGFDVRSRPAAVRARTGLVTDTPGLYEQMTPDGYLDFFGRVYGIEAGLRQRRIDELLSTFELDLVRKRRMTGFSRGMQQKVALARALLHDPEVVFLDEPTAGLDPMAARAVRSLIVRLKHASRSIVLCTHDLDEAERLADTVVILRRGRIVAADAPARLRANAAGVARVDIVFSLAREDAATVVAQIEGVEDVAQAAPTTVSYRTEQPRLTNPRVIGALVGAGAEVVSVTCEAPSLEDVYAEVVQDRPAVVVQDGPAVVWAHPGQPARPPDGDAVASTAPSSSGVSSPPTDATMTWLIAWRATLEALHDRMTLIMGIGTAFVLPVFLLVVGVRPLMDSPGLDSASSQISVPTILSFYLLLVGLVPTASAAGIAAGQFAGEKERGVLTPLLASPASNLAMFAGKVLGAILPALMYAAIADAVFIVGLGVVMGPDVMRLIPLPVFATMLLLVPEVTCFAAAVASLISSRVRTFNAAQQISGLVLMPLWGSVFGLAVKLQEWGTLGLVGGLVAILALDVLLAVFGARTWRREEVLSVR